MHNIKLLLSLVVATTLVFGLAAPAFAHPGHDHEEDARQAADTSSNSDDSEEHRSEGHSSRRQTAEETKLRTHGQELLTQLKKERQEHTQAERAKNCQSRKQGLQRKVNNLAENAQKHEARIDSLFAKTLAYKQDHNLTVENFATLNAGALTAQAAAQSSLEALDSLKPTLDCNNESVATDVAAFKVAMTQARSDLSEYRQAVKSLLRAVQSAKQGDQQ